MTLPVTFATLTAGNQPLSLIDTQSAALGALGVIPCAAAGQNAITLTPNANTPTISGYTDLAPSFSFVAAQTSNSSVTLNVAGLGARNAYKWNGQQTMAGGDTIAGSVYKATFLTALNSGAGGFVVDSVGVNNAWVDFDFIVDGGGNPITTGVKGFLRVPWAAVIFNWQLMADQAGSAVVDILRGTNFTVPTTSIVGTGNKPFLTAQQLDGQAVSGWTSTALASNDWLGFQIVSSSTITRLTITLQMSKQ